MAVCFAHTWQFGISVPSAEATKDEHVAYLVFVCHVKLLESFDKGRRRGENAMHRIELDVQMRSSCTDGNFHVQMRMQLGRSRLLPACDALVSRTCLEHRNGLVTPAVCSFLLNAHHRWEAVA